MIRTVAYVLHSFPVPSETFITDEMISLYGQNVRPCILHIYDGNLSKVHPNAQTLLDKVKLLRLGTASQFVAVCSLMRLLLRAPIRTIRTLTLALRSPDRWLYIQALPAAEWCLSQDVEFLHAHFANENLQYAEAIAAWAGLPYGVTTHRYDIFEDPIGVTTAARLFHGAETIVTISKFNREYMIQKYGLSQSWINIVHCGIDLDRFKFVDRTKQKNRQKLRILNVGRLVPQKAQDILLSAMALVKSRGVSFSLEIIGGGAEEAKLKKIAVDLGLQEEVIFHGMQTEIFVRERLAAVDLFVLSSRSEGLPVVLMEALAVGTPVIATRIFGIPELVEDGVSGLLVPPDEPEALADAVCAVYADQTLLTNMPVLGRQVVEAQFERAACTRQLIEVWSNAVAGVSSEK
jgi:glycosyltransferase involved in cell wall biosynthesis